MAKKIQDENGKVYVEKKPFYKRVWFIVIVIIAALAIISNLGGDKTSKDSTQAANTSNTSTEEISYEQADAGQMLKELESNALNAQKTYKDQNLEITGKIYVIDSSGSYIAIDGVNDDFTLTGITCNLKTDEQKDIVAGAQKGQTVTVKGKVTEVGEVMGYSLDVDEIIAQ